MEELLSSDNFQYSGVTVGHSLYLYSVIYGWVVRGGHLQRVCLYPALAAGEQFLRL